MRERAHRQGLAALRGESDRGNSVAKALRRFPGLPQLLTRNAGPDRRIVVTAAARAHSKLSRYSRTGADPPRLALAMI